MSLTKSYSQSINPEASINANYLLSNEAGISYIKLRVATLENISSLLSNYNFSCSKVAVSFYVSNGILNLIF